MSTSDNLYLKTDLSLDAVAETIARVVGGRVQETRTVGEPGVTIDQVANFPGWVTTFLRYRQGYYDPDLHDIADGFQINASVYYSKKQDEPQQEIARILTRRLVEHVPWPAILIYDFAWVLAAFDPERGYREYPARTVMFDDPYERLWSDPKTT
jgi:hypothetical protein